MVEIGKVNRLRCVKLVDFGIYLDGESFGEILMPRRYVPENTVVDDEIDAFIYTDSEDRIIATTQMPKVFINQIACLTVVAINNIGAFLDWGLPKDLLLPFREQKIKPGVGDSLPVYVYLDHESGRVVASAKVEKFLDNSPPEYTPGQEVTLVILAPTDLGYRVAINSLHTGIIYKNEVFGYLHIGDTVTGYIKKVREDEKIDCILSKPGYEKTLSLTETICNFLDLQGGFSSLNDKSNPEEIYAAFGCSKKAFKMAVGSLYKQKRIAIEPNGIRLL